MTPAGPTAARPASGPHGSRWVEPVPANTACSSPVESGAWCHPHPFPPEQGDKLPLRKLRLIIRFSITPAGSAAGPAPAGSARAHTVPAASAGLGHPRGWPQDSRLCPVRSVTPCGRVQADADVLLRFHEAGRKAGIPEERRKALRRRCARLGARPPHQAGRRRPPASRSRQGLPLLRVLGS